MKGKLILWTSFLFLPQWLWGQGNDLAAEKDPNYAWEKSWDQDSLVQEKPPLFTINGYLKYLPSYRNSQALNRPIWDQLVHQRLNIKASILPNWTVQGSLRTRFFHGGSFREFPFYKEVINTDFGTVDLSLNVANGNNWLINSTIDRLFTEFGSDKWQLRIGRQRINWGINTVSNPNDLFNTYSFFDFDYEERPGTDAVRFQYFTGTLSRVEIAYAPGRNSRESVAALYYTFNTQGYDYQFISGIFRNRYMAGFGWAGSIEETGIKGEVSFFTDLDHIPGRDPSNFVIGMSADHMFGNGIFLMVEYLYNQKRKGVPMDFLLFTQPLSADNLSLSDHSIFLQSSYAISPVVQAGIASFYYPSERALFFSPSLRIDLMENLDLLLIGQTFRGPQNSIFSQAGTLLATALKWNF